MSGDLNLCDSKASSGLNCSEACSFMPPVCMKRRIVSPAYSIVHTKHRKISVLD